MSEFTPMTPKELARVVDKHVKYVRHMLRLWFPNDAPGKGGRWQLTPVMVLKALGYWRVNEPR